METFNKISKKLGDILAVIIGIAGGYAGTLPFAIMIWGTASAAFMLYHVIVMTAIIGANIYAFVTHAKLEKILNDK